MKAATALLSMAALFAVQPVWLLAGTLQLEYSTYLGGSGYEGSAYAAIGGIAVDSEGCAYVSGITGSTDFPTENAYQSRHLNLSDVYILKFSSLGSSLIYSTYLGGRGGDSNYGISTDPYKCAYITGATGSNDFPTMSAYQPSNAGSNDAYICKLSSSGSQIMYSTYLGGSNTEYGYDIASDSNNCAHIIGDTYSSNFPTSNSYQSHYNGGSIWGGDAFIAGISQSGSTLIYSSYLGGTDSDYGRGIAIASNDEIFAVGGTLSADYPVINAYQGSLNGAEDIYISHFAPYGSSMLSSTYLGGSSYEDAGGIAIYHNNIYISGGTLSMDYPTLNAYQPSFSGGSLLYPSDACITAFEISSLRVVFSSYFGGADGEYGESVGADNNGNVYIIGWTKSLNIPTINAYQDTIAEGAYDAFASKLSSSGSSLIFSTYLGGNGKDRGENLAIDSSGCFYMSGDTESEDFPTINAYQSSYAGNIDTFVSKFKWEPSPTPTPISQIVTIDSGDYNGDGTSEIAVFRPSTGLWRLSDLGSTYFGREGDIPISGDYRGDGTSEIGVFRPSSGFWAVKDLTRFSFGTVADMPIPRDYDRDGKTDAAVFRPGDGVWSVRDLTDIYFGEAGDVTLPADYDGDGWINAAVFRPSSGLWAIRGLTHQWFGTAGDIPVPADYDLDGATEIAIYRPSTGLWAGILTGDAQTRIHLGLGGDIPVPADFDGGDWTQPAVFRPSSGLWAIRNLTRVYFGGTGDIPVTR